MRNDIKHGKELFKWLAPEQVAVLDEIEAQFATEFDYRQEASHLQQVRSNLEKAGFLGSWWRHIFRPHYRNDKALHSAIKGSQNQ